MRRVVNIIDTVAGRMALALSAVVGARLAVATGSVEG